MKLTVPNVIRWAGLPAMAAGIIFAVIQPIHPPDVLSSVTTDAWSIITPLKVVMSLFFLLGITGIYASQVKEAGKLGLVGFLLFFLSWALQTAFIFAEAFILPLLATEAPRFVEGVLGVVNGATSEMNLGALPALYALVSVLYLLGGLLFGIATLRAGILPRWAAGLLAFSGLLSFILVSLLPHHLERMAAVPMGFAVAWLGYALWSERRENVAQRLPDMISPQFRQTGAQ